MRGAGDTCIRLLLLHNKQLKEISDEHPAVNLCLLLLGLHVGRDRSVSHLKQLFSSQWVKYLSCSCVAFWDPGQRDFGSLGYVFLIIEGRWVLPEGQAEIYDAPNSLGRLGKGNLLFLSVFHWPVKITRPRPALIEQILPQWRQRRRKERKFVLENDPNPL